MKNWTLRNKTLLLLLSTVVVATVPLIVYFLLTAQGFSGLGSDPVVSEVLTRVAGGRPQSSELRGAAAGALTRYGQIQALRSSIVRQVTVVSVVYCAVVVLAALGIGYVFTSKITRPLALLTRATREYALDRLDNPLPVTQGGEIGTLMTAFNDMAGGLRQARREKLLAERTATWQRVARVIAHEIKNPITPIRLSTERLYEKFLLNSEDFPEVIRTTTATILHEIDNLQKLVDSFHAYARFPDPDPAPAAINDIVASVCPLFESSSVPLIRDFAPNLPQVTVDRGQIGQAVLNIVKNAVEAVEAAGKPGCVTVATGRVGCEVYIRISDTGPGVCEQDRDRLFQPYFTTKKQGSGIGLALTERIVSLHGGTITCDSTAGEGAAFTISLPLSGNPGSDAPVGYTGGVDGRRAV